MNEKDLSDSLLLKSIKQNGPLGAVFVAVAFDIIMLLNELYGNPQNPDTWRTYAGAAGIGTLIFLFVISFNHIFETKTRNNFIFRVLKEENHYEIQHETDCTVKIICMQNLTIKTLHDNQTKFRLFHPLEEYTPSKFEFPNGNPSRLIKQDFTKGIDGVGVYYPNRKFIKGNKEEITVIWTYENIPLEKGIMAAIIRRPTSFLRISVSLPAGNSPPQKTGWEMYNLERYAVRAGKANCKNYGDHYFITKSFRRTKEGFGYILWWDF
jgi:hypothetical protein